MEQLDYTPHYLEVKKKLTEIYVMLNNREYVPAATTIDEALVELRLMRNAVRTHIKE